MIFKYISLLCLNTALETVKLLYLKQPFSTICWNEKWTEIRFEIYTEKDTLLKLWPLLNFLYV